MALAKSIKMYLTIFVATTCIYMVLYQYHISRQPMPNPEQLKTKELLDTIGSDTEKKSESFIESKATDLVRRYNLFLWSPVTMLSTHQQQQQQLQQRQENVDSNTTETEIPSNNKINTTFQRQDQQNQKPATEALSTSSTSSTLSPSMPLSSSLYTSTSILLEEAKGLKQQNNNNNNSSNQIIDITHAQHDDVQRQNYINNSENSIKNNFIQRDGIPSGNVINSTMSVVRTKTRRTTNETSSFVTATKPSKEVIPTTTSSTTTTTTTTTTAATTATTTKTKTTKFLAEHLPPPLYIITPTYRRPEQLAELTRLGYTLKHIPNLLWLVIEDANKTSPLVTQILNRIGVPYEYLVAPMPEEYKKSKKPKPRGVSNRNRGLEWIRQNATEGVFYFADDDNTYDISIFEQMRYTTKVSMWPVGLVTKFGVSSPIIRNGTIDGFYDGWIGGRKYAVDMAGFAVSVKFLQSRPEAKMPFKPGYEEDGFLKSLAPLKNTEIELLASKCTEILTWHTQTKKNPPALHLNMTKYGNTNLVSIDKLLVRP